MRSKGYLLLDILFDYLSPNLRTYKYIDHAIRPKTTGTYAITYCFNWKNKKNGPKIYHLND
jgi:hypothetical protein